MNAIASGLKAFRKTTGLNQKMFASSVGLKYTTYNGYETGNHIPSPDVLAMIAEKYNITVDYLIGNSPDLPVITPRPKPQIRNNQDVSGFTIDDGRDPPLFQAEQVNTAPLRSAVPQVYSNQAQAVPAAEQTFKAQAPPPVHHQSGGINLTHEEQELIRQFRSLGIHGRGIVKLILAAEAADSGLGASSASQYIAQSSQPQSPHEAAYSPHPTAPQQQPGAVSGSVPQHGASTAVKAPAPPNPVQPTKQKPPTPESKAIKLYYNLSSIGVASPVYGVDYEDVFVQPDQRGDFAVRINDDTLDPYVRNGDIAFVESDGDLRYGDVGVFRAAGFMHIKQYFKDDDGNIHLFSINRNRSDDDILVVHAQGTRVDCFGKIVLPYRPPLPEIASEQS